MSILINAHELTHSFGGKTLFKNLSLGLHEFDRVGLVGPNGAGKSTLMKMLAQKMKADSGSVTWKKGLQIGYLTQKPEFPNHATLLETLVNANQDQHDPYSKAYEWYSKLNLTEFPEDQKVNSMSGGWQKRVALACELINSPEILFLDEPTNHLDIEAIMWLENFLDENKRNFATLVITHDRLFLQRVSEKIWDLDPRLPNNLLQIEGDYADYTEIRDSILLSEKQRESQMKNTLRRETEWLRRGAKARQTKQKARIDSAHSLKDDVEEISARNRDRNLNLQFGQNDKNPKRLIEIKNITKSYGDKRLLTNLDLLISPRTRLALIGANGAGKSSLIRILLKQEEPDQGQVFHADALKVNYFEQNRETLNFKKSLMKNICADGDYVDFQGEYVHAITYLERFLFKRQQMDLPVEKLSGGEQARLRIAQMMLHSAQVLILDEPTNDLDLETLNVLQETLQNFNGAVILVSHDRFFVDQVCDQLLSLPDQVIFSSFFQWEKAHLSGIKPEGAASHSTPIPPAEVTSKNSKKIKLSYKDQYDLDNMEVTVLKLEEQIAEKNSQLNNPTLASDSKKLLQLTEELNQLQQQLDDLYSRWAELEKKSKGE